MATNKKTADAGGVGQLALVPITADSGSTLTYGAAQAVDNVQSINASLAMVNAILRAAGKRKAVYSAIEGATLRVAGAEMDLQAFKTIFNADAITNDAGPPNSDTLKLKGGPTGVYLGIIYKPTSVELPGGDVDKHVLIAKCKVTEFSWTQPEGADFATFDATFEAIPRVNDNVLVELVTLDTQTNVASSPAIT